MKRFFNLSALLVLFLAAGFSPLPAQTAPHVEFNGDNAAPRSVEDLTGQSVPRDYGFAWTNMIQALDQNRLDLLEGYFTGFAKSNLTDRIKDQRKTGLHVRYTDHGHKLNVLFYSPNGDAMQLRDDADLEMEILDGSKVIQSEPLHVRYFVLMTPGADRWMVRDLETAPPQASKSGE
jgi:hypothetical protein